MDIRDFKEHVSSSAFRVIDGEPRIVGKFGQISVVGDKYDVWLVQPDLSPLTNRRINAILKNSPLIGGFQRLNGEAYIQAADFNAVLSLLLKMGIRKKRKVSQAELDRLAGMRARRKPGERR